MSFIFIWLAAWPILILGGFQPSFAPEWPYPVWGVVGYGIGAGLETLYLYWGLLRLPGWASLITVGLFMIWALFSILTGFMVVDVGGLPPAHSLWLLLALLGAAIIAARHIRQSRVDALAHRKSVTNEQRMKS